MKKNTVHKIIAITTFTSIAASGLASAQSTTTEAQKSIFQQAMSLFKSGKTDEAKNLLNQNGMKPFGEGKHGKPGKHGKMGAKNGDRKIIEDAIVAGNYATFQQVASTSPLKSITQDVFNQLVPQFQAKKNAEAQIRNILTSAGVQVPVPGKQ